MPRGYNQCIPQQNKGKSDSPILQLKLLRVPPVSCLPSYKYAMMIKIVSMLVDNDIRACWLVESDQL